MKVSFELNISKSFIDEVEEVFSVTGISLEDFFKKSLVNEVARFRPSANERVNLVKALYRRNKELKPCYIIKNKVLSQQSFTVIYVDNNIFSVPSDYVIPDDAGEKVRVLLK